VNKLLLFAVSTLVSLASALASGQTPMSDAQLRATQASAAPDAVLVPSPPDIAARAYLLMDANSGRVLAEHNADEQLAPASLTKMMTGYVLSEHIAQSKVSWDDQVYITENAWAQNPIFEGSSLMWVPVNTRVALRDLYYGLVISSGNDASVAIAEHVAGSEQSFADLMNQQAQLLGMTGSHFVNAHGLPDPAHVTTARDLAILSRAMIHDHPEDYKVYAERAFVFNNIRQGNRNELLGLDGVDGIKTGHTEDAGYCLVSSAEQNGMRLISVVLGTESKRARKDESRKLLTYGQRFFETQPLFADDPVLATAKVWGGVLQSIELGVAESVFLTVPRGQFDKLEATATVDPVIEAPITAGQRLGTVSVSLAGASVYEAPLVARESVEPAGFFTRIWDQLMLFFLQLFGQL